MALCNRCGKKGFFLRVDSNGNCTPCSDEIEAEKNAEEKRREAEEQERQKAEQEQKEIEAREQRWAVMREEEKRRREEYDKIFDTIPSIDINISNEYAPMLDVANIPFTNITVKTPREKLGDFVALDVETTGLYPNSNEIIEVAAIRFRSFEPESKFVSLTKPSRKISSKITKLTGITDVKVKDAPHFRQIAFALLDYIGNDNVVGHNLMFDLGFIITQGVDITSRKRKYFDTLSIAQKTLKKQRMKWDREVEGYVVNDDAHCDVLDHKLATLCKYYKIPHLDGHRAESDCYATGILLSKLEETRR